MLRNYLMVGLRALAKNKTYAFINIFGLALGLAACLLILLYVRYEMSYDAWMPGADRAYQFQAHYSPTDKGGEEMWLQMTSYSSGVALKKDFPQVEKIVYIGSGSPIIMQNGEATVSDDVRMVDGNLFDVLPYPFLHGDPRTALDNPNSLVLSKSEAIKRFGTDNAVGRTLHLIDRNIDTDYVVTGVFEDLPKNSHMAMSMAVRYNPQTYYVDFPQFLTHWGNQGGWIYAKLRPGASAAAINAQLPAWEKRNIPNDTAGGEVTNPGDAQDWELVNVRDIHLGKAQQASITPGNDRRTVATFAVIALLILGMACVNFTNLATARASQRAREVALRKVLGANRRQLVTQFLGESVLVAAISMLVALALVELLLPYFNKFLDADIAMHYFASDGLLLPIVALVLIVGAAGGLYPAFYLSRFQPAKILKANKSSNDAEGSGRLRNILVVGQFAVSIGLIICTAVIYAQTVYARTADAGYNRNGLLQISNIRRQQVGPVLDTLKREVERVPGVTTVSLTNIAVNPGNNSVTSVYPPGSTTSVDIGTYGIDQDFFATMGMKMLAGRNFSEAQARDDSTTPIPVDPDAERALVARGLNVVVSESAAQRLGFKSRQDAIGKEIKAGLTLEEYGGVVPSTIVGVVSDARFRSMRDPLQPILYTMVRSNFNTMAIRYANAQPKAVRDHVEAVWKRLLPEVPFKADFADDLVRKLYKRDEARGHLFAAFALLSVVVGCLGLFGLAAFTAERRTKEIGIRKVLGARTHDIVRLLVWQFSKPVIVANLLAWPVAWWVMRDWLNKFDSRIDLGPGPFLLAGLLALAIAIGTIAGHALKVARSNPINALRYE